MQDANETCEINLYLFVRPKLFEEKYSLPYLLWYSLPYCSLISISDNNSFQFILKCFGKAYLNCAICEHLSVKERIYAFVKQLLLNIYYTATF